MIRDEQADIDRIWEVIEKAGACMMTTRFSGLHVRPVVTLPQRGENAIWCLTDRCGVNEDEIEVAPEVYLTFVYPNEHVYLALTGEAFINLDADSPHAVDI